MVIRQKQGGQPAEVRYVLHASDEIFAEVQRVELGREICQ